MAGASPTPLLPLTTLPSCPASTWAAAKRVQRMARHVWSAGAGLASPPTGPALRWAGDARGESWGTGAEGERSAHATPSARAAWHTPRARRHQAAHLIHLLLSRHPPRSAPATARQTLRTSAWTATATTPRSASSAPGTQRSPPCRAFMQTRRGAALRCVLQRGADEQEPAQRTAPQTDELPPAPAAVWRGLRAVPEPKRHVHPVRARPWPDRRRVQAVQR